MQPNRIKASAAAVGPRPGLEPSWAAWLARVVLGKRAVIFVSSGIAALASGALGQSQAAGIPASGSILDSKYGVGSWIWTDETRHWQKCRFWRALEIPDSPSVKRARLRITAEDSWYLYLDGQELGSGLGLFLVDYDVTLHLTPGRHVFGVTGCNRTGPPGMVLGLRVELADGAVIELASDSSWRIVPNEVEQWEEQTEESSKWRKATVVGAFGASPWPKPRTIGSWIWAEETRDQQTCRFWRSFQIPDSAINQAWLYVTADNSYTLFLDGREIGKGAEWRNLTEYDLKPLLTAGEHVFAVEAFNDNAAAGMVLGLQVELANGSTVEIESDSSWRIASNSDKRWAKRAQASSAWPRAKVIAAFGAQPWLENRQFVMGLLKATPLQPFTLQFWQMGWFHVSLLSFCLLVVLVCLRLWARLAIQTQAQRVMHRERERIARDIHDDLTAGLTQLVLLGEISQREHPVDSSARGQFDQICESARGLLTTMSEVIWVVNSQRDTFKDFTSYVCRYAQRFLQSTAIQCQFDVDEEMAAIPCGLEVRRNLFLAVKEALNNAVRHSGATELFLRIHRRGQDLSVVVKDNGKGFDPELADSERNGLANMRQRAVEAGGVCHVSSQPGSGCQVEFTVPLQPSSRFRFLNRSARKWSPREPQLETAPTSASSTKPSQSGSP